MEGSNPGDATDCMFCPHLDVTKQHSAPNKRTLQSTQSLPEGALAEDALSLKSREKKLANGLANLEVQNKQLDKLRRSVEDKLIMGEEDLKKRQKSADSKEEELEKGIHEFELKRESQTLELAKEADRLEAQKQNLDEEDLKKRQKSAEEELEKGKNELELKRESQILKLANEADRLEVQKQKLDLEVRNQLLEHQRTAFNQEQMFFAKEKDLEQKNKAASDRENQLVWEKLEERKEFAAIQEAKWAEKEEEQKKCDQGVWKLEEAEHQLKMDTADMQKNRRDLKEERLQQNKESALLSIRERLLATGEEKLKKNNLQLEKEQSVLRNDKDLSTKRNEMARKEDLSLAKREQMMVRREEVFFQRELEMKKEKESFKKEKNQNEAFSRTLAKEKEEQVSYKVKFKRQEQKLREDQKMHEDKMKVDMRTFDKQKRQQKNMIRDLSMIHQPFSSRNQARASSRSSRGSGAASWSQSSESSISSRRSIAPKAEVIHQKMIRKSLHQV